MGRGNRKPGDKAGVFRFDWEGGLSEVGEDISSVELQHRALEWRQEDIDRISRSPPTM